MALEYSCYKQMRGGSVTYSRFNRFLSCCNNADVDSLHHKSVCKIGEKFCRLEYETTPRSLDCHSEGQAFCST